MKAQTPVLAANWKMHKSPAEAREFCDTFLARYPARRDRTVLIFPPALSLPAALEAVGGRDDVAVGVQHIHWESAGAYTGEISATMARAAGARFALIGHSERRQHFGETNKQTALKTRAALEAGLTPVLCVGETLDERRARRADAVVSDQLAPVLNAIEPADLERLLIAYEPVWAIGTGETASPEDAGAMHRVIREVLSGRAGETAARQVPILYGGSVKPDNTADLFAEPEVEGVLVGGASLEPESFAAICEASA